MRCEPWDVQASRHIRILTENLPNEAKLHRGKHQGKNGAVLVAQFLLDKKADVDAQDDGGDFPLMEAPRDIEPQKSRVVL